MADEAAVRVTIVFALPDSQVSVSVSLPPGTTLREALHRSGLAAMVPGLDPEGCKVGIYGQVADPDSVVRDGDRIEVYRPLKADPKLSRQRRAAIRRAAATTKT